MYWLLFALLEPIFHGFANIIDNYFVHNLFKRMTTLVFFVSFTNLLFLPIIFIFDFPTLITFSQIPLFLVLGATGVGYLYPYYKALQSDDTSIVISLFSFGKIFVPILAFFLVGEVLSLAEYIGFFIIILSATVLTFDGQKKFRPNAAFFWMILCTLIIALEVVVYKYVFTTMSWGTGFTWATLFSFIFALSFLLFPKTRLDIISNIQTFRKNFKLFAFEELLTFAGSAASTLAISLASVTLVSAISSFQPVFVLFYALLLGRFFPKAFKEKLALKNIIKKLLSFVVMVLGVIVILFFS
jgi:uncharacterized membrane protein